MRKIIHLQNLSHLTNVFATWTNLVIFHSKVQTTSKPKIRKIVQCQKTQNVKNFRSARDLSSQTPAAAPRTLTTRQSRGPNTRNEQSLFKKDSSVTFYGTRSINFNFSEQFKNEWGELLNDFSIRHVLVTSTEMKKK